MRLIILLLVFPFFCIGQVGAQYAVSASQPYGKLNPDAPKETGDYAPLIGTCDCTSTARNADQSWAKPEKMTWTFKYIMDGNAVQDETIKADGGHSGSIRQFIADSSKWYVHYYSVKGPTPVLSAWEGEKKGDSIVLYREQKAPNGTEGYYRITFSNLSNDGFNWLGEWVNKAETFTYPTWKIICTKTEDD